MPPPLDPAKRAAILADIQAGNASCRGIARAHDVSRTTVSQIAKDAGLNEAFGRQQTKKATEAAQADNKARRAVEATESLTAAAHLRKKIFTARGGRDAQGWATAYGIMADKHMAFERHDADTGAAGARSVLGRLGEALQLAAEQIDGTPPDES